MTIVKASAVGLEEQKQYCLSLRSFFVKVFNYFFDSFKRFVNDSKEADRDTGQTLDTFYGL